MKKNSFQKSTFGAMYYILLDGVCYFSVRRRGLEETLTKVKKYNDAKNGKIYSELDHYLFVEHEIEKNYDLLNYFLKVYSSSQDFIRDKYFAFQFNPKSQGDLEILADVLVCIDHNKGDTTSSVNYNGNDVQTSFLIWNKKKGISKFFSSSNQGSLVSSLPLATVISFVAENKSITFKTNNGEFFQYGNQSSITEENYDQLYNKNQVDFYG